MAWLTETTDVEVRGRQHTYTIGIKPRAFRKDGSLRVIPPGFGATGDAQLPHGREGLLDTRMAERLAGQSPQVHIGRGQSHIRMSALGTNNVAGVAAYDALGNVIGRRFNGAWQGADLEWLDGGHYVRKYVHLHAGHPTVFEVRIDGMAGRLVPSPRGWDLQDDAGRPVLWAGRGYLFKPNDPMALTYPVQTTVRVQGGKWIYTYTLPAPLPGKPGWEGWTLDPSWTSQPDSTSGEDTHVHSASATNNWGVAANIELGNVGGTLLNPLLRFGFVGSPATATWLSASLGLYFAFAAGLQSDRDAPINIMEISDANGDWVEGTKGGTQAGAGEPCWNAKAADGAGGVTTAWAGSAGLSTAGTDYINTSLATATKLDNDTSELMTFTFNATGLTRLKAIAAGAANNGLLVLYSGVSQVYWTIATSDNATASQRPSLTVVTEEAQRRRNRLWWFGLIGGMAYAA